MHARKCSSRWRTNSVDTFTNLRNSAPLRLQATQPKLQPKCSTRVGVTKRRNGHASFRTNISAGNETTYSRRSSSGLRIYQAPLLPNRSLLGQGAGIKSSQSSLCRSESRRPKRNHAGLMGTRLYASYGDKFIRCLVRRRSWIDLLYDC